MEITQNYLMGLGYDVEVVDFVPEGLSFFRAIWPKGVNPLSQIIKVIPLFICNLLQFQVRDSFLKKQIKLTARKYHSFEDLKKHCPEADIYLSGSDQVWNTQNSNSPEDIGAYYLAFVTNKPKIAYAGSFGKTDINKEEAGKFKNGYNSIMLFRLEKIKQ